MTVLRLFARHALLFALGLGLAGCVSHKQYRSDYSVCSTSSREGDLKCPTHALQQLTSDSTAEGTGGEDYLLGFIEFDDQGQLWSREQMHKVLDGIERESKRRDLLMVVFAHGWQHSASPDDGNIQTFRRVLSQLAESERYMGRNSPHTPRKVVGVYLGWRGESVSVPVLQFLTFWDRKSTATKVGKGAITEVLARLEQIKRSRDDSANPQAGTRLVVVGHSFGGLVVHNALAQLLQGRFVRNQGADGQPGEVEGFGNLVVLINPAFEAMQFIPISDMAAERKRYVKGQLPAIAVLTSETDYATRYAFPFGRSFNTMMERTRDYTRPDPVSGNTETISQYRANVTAIGHFEPFRTHRLYPLSDAPGAKLAVAAPVTTVQSALAAARAWENDAPGSQIRFSNLMLERTANSSARNPYLLIQVDKRLIKGHNDIDDERVIDFLKQLVLISTVPVEKQGVLRKSLGVE